MAGLIESATAILSASEKRVEAASRNVANASTAGFKKQVGVFQIVEDTGPRAEKASRTAFTTVTDFAQGRLNETGKPLDLAIHGKGLVKLRSGSAFLYSRGGSFSIGPDGAVTDAAGRILQDANGADLVLESDAVGITGDGTVTQGGVPITAIGLYEADGDAAQRALGGTSFTAAPERMHEATGSILRQGMLESSNVALSDEMVAMMAAQRQAESGARIARTYDRLIGQAVSTFSGGGR